MVAQPCLNKFVQVCIHSREKRDFNRQTLFLSVRGQNTSFKLLDALEKSTAGYGSLATKEKFSGLVMRYACARAVAQLARLCCTRLTNSVFLLYSIWDRRQGESPTNSCCTRGPLHRPAKYEFGRVEESLFFTFQGKGNLGLAFCWASNLSQNHRNLHVLIMLPVLPSIAEIVHFYFAKQE